MTQGLTREQLGVTDAMITSYGDVIFRLSNNLQTRRGDPVRTKNFAAIEAHRHELGMADRDIAERIGLTPAQVTFIRNLEERRRFRRGHYHALNKLGGGKRFRAERMTPFQDHFRFGADALALRAQFAFDPDRVRGYVEDGFWRADTLGGYLQDHAKQRPNAVAIVDDHGSVTYSELAESVSQLAGGLYAAGVRPGDVVAIQLPNVREYIESFLAICTLGAVMTTLYTTYREAELSTQLQHSRARALIASSKIGDFEPAAWAVEHKRDSRTLALVIAVGPPVEGALNYAELGTSQLRLPADLADPTAADPFLLLYTSGTTSSPKGVPLNAHQMLSNARLGLAEHDIREGDRLLSAAPFGHLFALYSVHMALAAGAAIVLLEQFTPPDLMRSMRDHQATHVFAGPAHFAACLGAGLVSEPAMTSVRLIVLSGATVSADLVRGLSPSLANGKLCHLWGMTELQAGLYTRLDDDLDVIANCAGRPSPGTEVRIVDDAGQTAQPDHEGELQVRGASVFTGYFDNPDATTAAFTADGWFRSGDLARMDATGNVTLTGRLKDVINRGGVKYNPQEIEVLVEQLPAVAQCAVAPIADAALGERACCFVVLRDNETLRLDDVCAFLLDHGIAKYKLPERLEILAEMPLTATRKIIKSRLQPS